MESNNNQRHEGRRRPYGNRARSGRGGTGAATTPSVPSTGGEPQPPQPPQPPRRHERRPRSNNNAVQGIINNFTPLWLAAFRDNKYDVRYLEGLEKLLSELSINVLHSYPSVAPPPNQIPDPIALEQAQRRAAPRGPDNGRQQRGGFDGLNDAVLIAAAPQPAPGNSGNDEQNDMLTNFYLLLRCKVVLADSYKLRAIYEEKQRAWDRVAELWTNCYNSMNSAIERLAILKNLLEIRIGDDSELFRIYDGNSQVAVHDELVNLGQLENEREKTRALDRLDKHKRNLERKLNPMVHDRDEIKRKIGEDRWRNNPDPKMDYAEKIRLLKIEKEKLERALEIIASLQFPGFVNV